MFQKFRSKLYRLSKGFVHLYNYHGVSVYFSLNVISPKLIGTDLYLPLRLYKDNLKAVLSDVDIAFLVRKALSSLK